MSRGVDRDGNKKPEGLMVDPRIQTVANGHATNLSTDALIALMYSLPGPYRNRGAWAMNGTTLGTLRARRCLAVRAGRIGWRSVRVRCTI